jgi:hypothetical protein
MRLEFDDLKIIGKKKIDKKFQGDLSYRKTQKCRFEGGSGICSYMVMNFYGA